MSDRMINLGIPPKPVAVVGVFLFLAGVLLLVYPVSVSSYGLTASCGTTITRDNSEATALASRFKDTEAADELRIPTPAKTDVSPIKKCTDALVLRRWIAWPATGVGVLLAAASLRVVLTDRLRSRSVRTTASYPSEESDRSGRGTLSETNLVAPTQPPVSVEESVSGRQPPPAAPPGWYNDPHLHQHLRWFDGTQWTASTAPFGDASSPTSNNDRGSNT